VNHAPKVNMPGAPVALWAASTANAFQGQGRMFSGGPQTLRQACESASKKGRPRVTRWRPFQRQAHSG